MATNVSSKVTDILNASIKAVESVVPDMFQLGSPRVTTSPIEQTQLGVIIGVTGEVRGRFFVSSSIECFSRIGKQMYGMDLDPQMTLSFASEFTNMLAGNMSRNAEHLNIDISPPTTVEGGAKLHGFDRAILVPLESEEIGLVTVALILEDM